MSVLTDFDKHYVEKRNTVEVKARRKRLNSPELVAQRAKQIRNEDLRIIMGEE